MSKDELSYSLSDQDIYKLNPNTKLILYEDIQRFRDIDHLLYPFESVIILYEWQRTRDASIGHYITVNRVPAPPDPSDPKRLRMCIEHFDSYAIKPDKELDQLRDESPAFKRMTGQDQKYLLHLYARSRYPISYNHYPFQSLAEGVSTCGRYAVLRSKLKHMPLDEFAKLFIGQRKSPDQIAVELTQKNLLR